MLFRRLAVRGTAPCHIAASTLPSAGVQYRFLRCSRSPLLEQRSVGTGRFRGGRHSAPAAAAVAAPTGASSTAPAAEAVAPPSNLAVADTAALVAPALESAGGAVSPPEVPSSAAPPPAEDAGPSDGATPPPPPPKNESGIQRLLASWQQGVVASIGAVMGIGFLVYMLYAPVKEDTVHHTAVVASEALGDLRLKSKAVQVSKDIVSEVLQDEHSLSLVVEFVRKLLAQEDTKIAISSLLQSLFEDHYTQEVTKKFVLVIVRDPWIMDQIQVVAKEQVMRLLADDEIKQALSTFLVSAASTSLREPELQYETARAVRSSLARIVNPWGV